MNKRLVVWQFGKYATVGALGAGLDLLIFYFLTRHLGLGYLVANLISVLTVMVHNFIWHKYLTFKAAASQKTKSEFKKFIVVSGSAFVIQQIGLPLLVFLPGESIFGSHEDLVAKILMVGIVGVVSFYFNRAWTFKKSVLDSTT